MIVSLRTLINTTLFRALMFFWFWAYTKYDPTPAKELIHFVWWDKLWNITVTNEACESDSTVDKLSNQLIAERLNNIEQLCARSIRLPIYDQMPATQPIYSQPTTLNTNFTANPTTVQTTNSTWVRVIENNVLRNTSGTLQF